MNQVLFTPQKYSVLISIHEFAIEILDFWIIIRGRGMARGRLGAVDMNGQVQQQGRGKGFRRGGRGAGGDMNGAVRGELKI